MPEVLYFSFHAAKRCLERGITERNVADTVLLGSMVWDDGEKATYARGRMRVILSDGLVITAYRQKKRNPKRNLKKRRQLLRQYARRLR